MNALYPVMKGRSQSYGVLIMEKKAYQLPSTFSFLSPSNYKKDIHEKSLNNKINKMVKKNFSNKKKLIIFLQKFSYNPLNLSSPLSPIKSPKSGLKDWTLPTEPSPCKKNNFL